LKRGKNMIRSYNDLTDDQKSNLQHFLDFATGHELYKLRSLYGVPYSRNLEGLRENVIHSLMMDQIPFGEYLDWTSHVYLEGNNYIYVYEPKDKNLFKKNPIKKLYTSRKKKCVPIYNINAEDLNTIKLTSVHKPIDQNQLIFTLAAPAQIQVKNEEKKILELKKVVYLAYVIMDYDLKHFALYMHPTTNLNSIMTELKKKDYDELTWIIMLHFKKLIINFENTDPDWFADALSNITSEFFYHNNPKIEEKLNEYNELFPDLIELLESKEKLLKRQDTKLRFMRAMKNMLESELEIIYKRISKPLNFDVFLQQSGKGIMEFKANSKGRAFNHADAAEVIRLMWENGELVSLGIIHHHKNVDGENKAFPYIASFKRNAFFSLKRTNTATTEKEVVDHVLRKLNKYQQEVRSTSGVIEKTGFGTDDIKT
jgi:hypothetical protein